MFIQGQTANTLARRDQLRTDGLVFIPNMSSGTGGEVDRLIVSFNVNL